MCEIQLYFSANTFHKLNNIISYAKQINKDVQKNA